MNSSTVIAFADPSQVEAPIDGAELLAINVPRSDVERGHIGSALSPLLSLTDSPDRVRRFAGRLILCYDGYNDDARALPQIPQVVAHFAKLHDAWPHWAHFLVKAPEQFGFILQLLAMGNRCGGRPYAGGGLPAAQAGAVLLGLMGHMNLLYETFGMGQRENVEMTQELVQVLEDLLDN